LETAVPAQPPNSPDQWVESQACYQRYWLRRGQTAASPQASLGTDDLERRLLALQAFCDSLAKVLLCNSPGAEDASAHHRLAALKRIKHAAICSLPASDPELIRFSETFLSDTIRRLCEEAG
jgi:hypothetical protein